MTTAPPATQITHDTSNVPARLVRVIFTIALLGTTMTGVAMVLLQVLAAALDRADLVISLYDTLVPAAAIMASVVCLSSFIGDLLSDDEHVELDH